MGCDAAAGARQAIRMTEQRTIPIENTTAVAVVVRRFPGV
jgi:hypothetical protein